MVGALFSGWTTTVRRPGRAVLIAVAVWGLGIAGFGLATFSFPLALLFLAIAAGADVISAVLRSSIVQIADAGRAAGPGDLDPHPGGDRRAADRRRRGERGRRRSSAPRVRSSRAGS